MPQVVELPDFDAYYIPILRAIRALGGSASTQEINERVATEMNLSESQLAVMHGKSTRRTRFSYRMSMVRTYLKRFGLIENSQRGVWALTPDGRKAGNDDVRQLVRDVERARGGDSTTSAESAAQELLNSSSGGDHEADDEEWITSLLARLRAMPADAFERLCQRLLRESGFIEVEVTGRSGDGGIDGTGILRLNNMLSFHVVFQCKRYKDLVGPSPIRDFRGAMVGRTDKGLFITTGTFTREALKEATRDEPLQSI